MIQKIAPRRQTITNNNIPNTLRAVSSEQETRPQVFDPALLHFPRAFRLGEPASASQEERLQWARAHAEVRGHLLALIAQSRWKEHLVLRGSTLLQSWFGKAAREPKDIDWVFQPQTVKLGDPQCEECYAGLVELVKQNPRTPNAEILTSRIASDDIWTYERASGRRIVFPFRTSQGMKREVQMDIAWSEPLFEAPIEVSVSANAAQSVSLWAATPELSLAWKMLWLHTDMHPQGKDLYDAVLLAENTRLSSDLVRRVFEADGELEWLYRYHSTPLHNFIADLNVDWDNFKVEYPEIEGEQQEWAHRLIAAITPTLEGLERA